MRPTVLIVDDHADFRRSARAMLEVEGYAVVGEAADGASALSILTTLRPDVVLLDVQLPDMDGFDIAVLLAAGLDPPAVVLVSSRDADSYGHRLEESAVRGFISKSDLSGAALTAVVG
ncbi:MAG: response regulator [Nocardioides sp.]|uniref:response regulator n=1 Tax=Nocardioides sp. TaxID=35761 RepID=UPI0032679C13